jgi:HEAT repeat protein
MTRRHAVGIAIDEKTFTLDELVEIAVRDPDTAVATNAGVAVIAKAAEAGDLEALTGVLRGRPQVRRAALDAWPDSSPRAMEIASARLFDSSPLVRTGAQNLMRRIGGDPAPAYREALQSDRARIALIELGLIGSRQDRELVLAALDDPDARIRRAAIGAISWLDADSLVDTVGRLVDDSSSAVAIAAARRLRRVARRVPADIANRWLRRPEPGVRLAGLAVARRRGDYQRLEADLSLLDDPDDAVREVARRDLAAWWPKRATAFQPRADVASRRRIGELLDAAGGSLTERQVAEIRFAAGLRPTDLG